MSALLHAELLKLRTTRVSYGLAFALLALVALTVVASLATADDLAVTDETWRRDLIGAAGFAVLFATLLGMLLATTEYRHATITPTFLVTPVRYRVLAAKLVVGPAAGLVLVLAACALVLAIAAPWLAARGAGFDLGGDGVLERIGATVLAVVLWSALGVAIGALVRNLVAAIVATLVWLIVVEPLISLASASLGRYLPGAALDRIGGGGGDDLLPFWGAVLLTLAYVAVLAAAAIVLTERRDVS